MAKRLQEYVKYSTAELETYITTPGSCVHKINSTLHLSLSPHALTNFKKAVLARITRWKVGFYEARLDGIILDVKNIKVIGPTATLRGDDPHLHVNINGDFYVFRPVENAELSGVVKHIGNHHVGAVIYRVFNVSIRFKQKLCADDVCIDQEVRFRIRNFNMQNVFPYIEGELLLEGASKGRKTLFADSADGEDLEDSTLHIKQEEDTPSESHKPPVTKETSKTKRKRKTESLSLPDTPVKVKEEQSLTPTPTPTKKKKKDKAAKLLKLDIKAEQCA